MVQTKHDETQVTPYSEDSALYRQEDGTPTILALLKHVGSLPDDQPIQVRQWVSIGGMNVQIHQWTLPTDTKLSQLLRVFGRFLTVVQGAGGEGE